MSLFPVGGGPSASGTAGAGPAEWVSNNTSFRPELFHQQQHEESLGRYATRADFLRAAERYLEDSSSEDDGGAAAGQHVHPPTGSEPNNATTADGERQSGPKGKQHKGPHARGRSPNASPSSSSSSPPCSRSSSADSRRGHKRKRGQRRSRSRSRSGSPRDGKRKHHKRHSKRHKAKHGKDHHARGGSRADPRDEREKILRLERAAAAAGLAPRQAASLLAGPGAGRGPAALGAHTAGQMYYDTTGDVQNLVYQALYGGDIATYHRVDPLGLARATRARRLAPGAADDDGEPEAAGQAALRYFSGRVLLQERSRRLRRLHLREEPVVPVVPPGASAPGRAGASASAPSSGAGAGRGGWLTGRTGCRTGATLSGCVADPSMGRGLRAAMPLPNFLPLSERRPPGTDGREGDHEGAAGGETAEEWVLRRTREFNVAVREAPQRVELWLQYAAFQDTCARLLARRGHDAAAGAAAATDKQVAILQRGLEAHPGDTRLLVALMATCEKLLDPEALLDRWDRLLRRQPGSPTLWRQYLDLRCALFGTFKLPRLRLAYDDAMHALAAERAKRAREAAAADASGGAAAAAAVSGLEQELCRLVLEQLELELGAGLTEAAVARLQALVEFHFFAPSSAACGLGLGRGGGAYGGLAAPGGVLAAGQALRLFDNFWEGGAARVGEEGAAGWSAWYRQENEALWLAPAAADKPAQQEREQEEEQGGWSGWIELPPPLPPPEEPPPLPADAAGGEAEEEEEGELEDLDRPELTEEELLAQLGLRLDEQVEAMRRQGVTPHLLARWLRAEAARDAQQWLPLRPPSSGAGGDADAGAEVDVARVVTLVEIRDGVFVVEDPDLRLDLVLACLQILGVPLLGQAQAAPGCCRFAQLLPEHSAALAAASGGPGSISGGRAAALDTAPWFLADESRRRFLSRLLEAMVSGPCAEQPAVCLALLLVEAAGQLPPTSDRDPQQQDLGAASSSSSSPSRPWSAYARLDAAREAAKRVLAKQRSSVAMLTALLALEGGARQAKAARRIADAALGSAAALPEAARAQLLPQLLAQYVQAELLVAAAATGGVAVQAGPGTALGLLRAHHGLRWFLAGGCSGANAFTPFKAPPAASAADAAIPREEVAAARRSFEALIPLLLSTAGGRLDARAAACLYLAGAFEALTGRLMPPAAGLGGGLAAAMTLFKHACAAVPAAVRQASPYHEELAVRFCGLMVAEMEAAQARAAVSGSAGQAAAFAPAQARVVLLQALELYPHSSPLLVLLLRLGRLSGAQCRLRLDLAAMAEGLRERQAHGQQADAAAGAAGPCGGAAAAASAAVWAAHMAAEAGRTGTSGARMRALLERAAASRQLARCGAVWEAYLAHELLQGQLDSAKRVFLRGIRECPGHKALWMQGFAHLGCREGGAGEAAAGVGAAVVPHGALSPREVAELMGVAGEKGVRLRTDVYEALLEHLAEEQP